MRYVQKYTIGAKIGRKNKLASEGRPYGK